MILKFPDLDTLRIALIANDVPEAVWQAQTTAGLDDDGGIWLDTPARVTTRAQDLLRRRGVQTPKKNGARMSFKVSSWLELIPLQRDGGPLAPPEQAPVLFDLPSGQHLSRMVAEVLRLGNDRQSYRWLEETGKKSDAGVRALLRVVGPPYYSLLRALDPQGADATRAYLERAPGVWVELGYTHALVGQIKAPEGQMILLRPPRHWTFLPEGQFKDVYEVLEFTLPGEKLGWKEGQVSNRLRVPLSLARGGGTEAAELWVLREDPVHELNNLVQNADDHLLNRLAFAVGEQGDKKTIVLRVRPSKLPPPVLVVRGEAFRPFLKLPNLFLPIGWRLHPPLRRDVVRKLLADDPNILTWLYPETGGTFIPETLAHDAFRPLTDWVDYVVEHDREALQAWVQAMTFEFESFVCNEDELAKPRKPPAPEKKPSRGNRGGGDAGEAIDLQDINFTRSAREVVLSAEDDDPAPALEKVEPSVLQVQLTALEEKFSSLEGPLDIPERQDLWPEMAVLNAQLTRVDDASICWQNALWAQDEVPASWVWNWLRTEATSVPPRAEKGRSKGFAWTAGLLQATGANRVVSGEDLDRVLSLKDLNLADARSLAAYLVWASRQTPPPQSLVDRLNAVQQFLEANENLLSIRGTWLAWMAFSRLTGGDVLALARARDRLLERLFHNGLRPEQDLPAFLRFSGQPSSQRFRAVRQWMTNLCKQAHDWPKEASGVIQGQAAAQTHAYINLTFAYGLARMGELDASRKLMDEAKKVLLAQIDQDGNTDEAHQFLFRAFTYRVKMAQEGKRNTGPLPPEELEYLEKRMERLKRYVVERLRQHSRILEPDQKIDPYRTWSAKINDLEKALADLTDLGDRKEIARRVETLLKTHAPKGNKGYEARVSILRTALNLAPRVSEEFALDMLTQLLPTYDALPEARDAAVLEQQANLLEKGLFVAAHFDRKDHVQQLVARFQRLLQSQRGNAGAIQSLDTLAEHGFRGLRKLGMREEIDVLLRQMENVILEGQDISAIDMKADRNWPVALRALLHVAAGWLYFGRDRQAEPIINTVRTLLFSGQLMEGNAPKYKEQTQLARAYALTVGQAPVEAAQKRLEELFHKLKGVKDTYTTSTHYSLSQLDVVEAVVLSVVNEDSSMGADARRWLDDDEFIVRRRIHRDFREMQRQAH
jgi:FtsH ternary system domain X7